MNACKLQRPKAAMGVEEFLQRKRDVQKVPSVEASIQIWLRRYCGGEIAPDGLPYALGPFIHRSTKRGS